MRDPLTFPGRVPLVGGATVNIDNASPADIVEAMRKLMPHYAQAVYRQVTNTGLMLGECLRVLKAAGMTEIPRARAVAPNGGNGGDEGEDGPGI
jgi:hypothetical protein